MDYADHHGRTTGRGTAGPAGPAFAGEDAMRNLDRTSRLAPTGVLLALTLGLAGGALAGLPATFDEALARAAEQDKLVVIDFYTDW
jgi:hypothetical protein